MKDKTIEHPFYLQLQGDINYTDRKSDTYRNLFYIVRVALILIATMITIFSGFKPLPNLDMSQDSLFNILLLLGALTTAITASDTLFQLETKKNTYKLMLVELREIRSEVVYYYNKGEQDLKERIDTHLFQKYQSIMAYSKTLIGKDTESKEKNSK